MPKPTRAEMAALVERLRDWWTKRGKKHMDAGFDSHRDVLAAADAIEALMQECAEPVAHMDDEGVMIRHKAWLATDDRGREWYNIPLYAAPPAKPARDLTIDEERVMMRALQASSTKIESAKPAGELPPLPEPFTVIENAAVYTANDLRAYALRAIREQQR